MSAFRQPELLQAGTRAPDFRLKRLSGGEATLHELIANGPILLAFFKVTCPVCQFTFPFLERIYAAGTLPIYGISQHDAEDTREFAGKFGISFPILLDEQDAGFPASNAYGISSVPTLFLVERDGTISHVLEGWSRKEIEWLGGKAGINPIHQDENVPSWKSG
jgi:peroxiredoxin